MLNEKELAARSLGTSRDMAAHVARFRRLATGIRNIQPGLLDLTGDDRTALAEAVAVLDRAASVCGRAAKLKALGEKQHEKRVADARELVLASNFAKLRAVDDVVAFVATQASYQITQSPRIDNVYAARYFVRDLFGICLTTSLASEIARQPAPLHVTLELRWAEFLCEAPALKDRYAVTISDLLRFLASDPGASVNRV
ncbi:hypothetical protein RBH89_13500 [Paracidovorax avenae]